MDIVFLPQADEDLLFWKKSNNKTVLKKIAQLTRCIVENPFEGIGKPEALKYDLAPKWSRRITKEHRYIYLILDRKLYVYSLRGHYM